MKSYLVEGMTCSGCVNAITNAIKAKQPAAEVVVDLETGRVDIEGEIAETAFIEAVEDAGFNYKGAAA